MSDGLSAKYRLARFMNKFPVLFRHGKASFDLKSFESVHNEIVASGGVKDLMLVEYPVDVLGYTVMSLIVQLGEYPRTKCFNAYELMDIYLGKNDTYLSLGRIECDLVIVYMGYCETANKLQESVIESMISQQAMRGKRLWLCYKGGGLDIKYPRIKPLMTSQGAGVVRLSCGNVRKSDIADDACSEVANNGIEYDFSL